MMRLDLLTLEDLERELCNVQLEIDCVLDERELCKQELVDLQEQFGELFDEWRAR